jgi:hypothetical protein
MGLPQYWGWRHKWGIFRVGYLAGDGRSDLDHEVAMLGAGGETRCTDVMEISRPDGIGETANLGLTQAEAKWLLDGAQ